MTACITVALLILHTATRLSSERCPELPPGQTAPPALQVLLNNGAGGLNAAMAANKKQREVYVGNLVIGQISDLMLRELFNAALAHFVADPVTRPPVVSVTMDGSGRFGFVELRTEELAAEAMKLDKVNLGGREINVGRPKGYIEPPPGSKIEANKVRLTPPPQHPAVNLF